MKRRNFSEADKLLTVLTPNYGKIIVLGKGVRKIHSRKAPHLEIFNHVILNVARGRNLDIVTEVETLETFPLLRQEIARVAYVYRVVEEVDRLCAEGEVHNDIFHLLLAVLRKLNEKEMEKVDEIVDSFTLTLLWNLGYLPRENVIKGVPLRQFFESVIENHLKSDSFLKNL